MYFVCNVVRTEGMVALWASASLIHIAPAITALGGLGILLLTGVITWEDHLLSAYRLEPSSVHYRFTLAL